jgi:hypothetical protein
MPQNGNRKTRLQPDAGDALPMGAFRPNPSWYEEHWLREARPAPPSVIHQCLAWLAAFARALVKLPRLSRRTLIERPGEAGRGASPSECNMHLAASGQVSNCGTQR